MIVTFIPAAGRSSRMREGDKLLETVGGMTMLRRTATVALSANLGPVIVGLSKADEARRKTLQGIPVDIVDVTDAADGMSATLKAGARAARMAIDQTNPKQGNSEDSGMLVLLPDMPGIEAADLKLLGRTFQSSGSRVVRATTEDGTPGHPVLFPYRLLAAFEELTGDKGASSLLKNQQALEVALQGNRATLDLDTPEDWAAWRRETGNPD